MPVNEQVVDSVASANLKNLGDQPAFYAGLGYANAIAHQQAMQQQMVTAQAGYTAITQATVTAAVKSLLSTTPEQAVSDSKLLTGNDLASTLANLLSALQAGQVGTKVAQTTPPDSTGK